jgi:hypothetical protein
MLFIINGAGLIFPWKNRIFLQRNGPKQSKICTLGIAARNIFLVFEKEKRFLENKKRTFNKVRVFQNFKLFSTLTII